RKDFFYVQLLVWILFLILGYSYIENIGFWCFKIGIKYRQPLVRLLHRRGNLDGGRFSEGILARGAGRKEKKRQKKTTDFTVCSSHIELLFLKTIKNTNA